MTSLMKKKDRRQNDARLNRNKKPRKGHDAASIKDAHVHVDISSGFMYRFVSDHIYPKYPGEEKHKFWDALTSLLDCTG